MITLKDISFSYQQHQVIKNLNLECIDATIHGLIGLNGSGKTTLLRCIASLLSPESGEILLNNILIKRSDVSLLETEPYFYHGITGREFLNLFPSSGLSDFKTNDWGELFNIPLDELIDGYSTGMKKKLALTLVIKLDRSVILLDEPFNGLDLESSRILSLVLKQIVGKGRVIIVTSHILDTLTDICTQIHYLNNGIIHKSFGSDESQDIESFVFKDLDATLEKKIKSIL